MKRLRGTLMGLMFISLNVFSQTWITDLIPLKTRITDVSVLTGIEGKKVSNDKVLYTLKAGNLFVGVSPGRCKDSTWGSWDVEEGVILGVIFYPKPGREPSHYGFKTDEMKVGFDHEQRTYTDEKSGVYFSTQLGKVTTVYLSPSSDYQHLKCISTKSGNQGHRESRESGTGLQFFDFLGQDRQ